MADLKNMLHTIFDNQADLSDTCRECQAKLHIYIDTELAGQEMESDMVEIGQHLDDCATCRQAYTELKDLLALEQKNQLVAPPVEHEFDFSYLDQNAEASAIWQVVAEAGQQVRRLFIEIPILLGKKMAAFGQLPPSLKLETFAAPVMRDKSSQSESLSQLLSLPPTDDVAFGLRVEPRADGKATLGIQLKQASSQQALNKARVTLRDNQRRMLESHTVSNTTEIIIHDVSRGSYLVEIKYKDQVWELPLTIAPEDEHPT